MDGGIRFEDSGEVKKVEMSVSGVNICANSCCPNWEFFLDKRTLSVGLFLYGLHFCDCVNEDRGDNKDRKCPT